MSKLKESIIVPENADDGWGDDIESILEDPIDRVERLAYEVRNARRGSYADFGSTPDDLIEELYSISENFNQVANEIQSDDIEFEGDEDLDESVKLRESNGTDDFRRNFCNNLTNYINKSLLFGASNREEDLKKLEDIISSFRDELDMVNNDFIEYINSSMNEACKGKKKKPIKESAYSTVIGPLEDQIKNDIKEIVEIGFNGTDFTVSVGEIDLIAGTVEVDVYAYTGDEELHRTITLHFPSLDYNEALSNEIENWMAEHGSPDNFYESVETIKEAKAEPKYNLIDLRSKTAKDVKEDFKKFYKDWIFTWEGMLADEDNLNAIVKELKLKNPTFYIYTGKQMNSVYGLHGNNAYPADLTFLSIEDFQDPGAKIRYGARWFTDIVDNNRRRENYNRRSMQENVNLKDKEKNIVNSDVVKEASEYYKELNLKRLEAILRESTK